MRKNVKHNVDAKKITKVFEDETMNLVDRIAIFYAKQLSHAVNQGGPGESSPDGDPPFVQTGTLLRSLQANFGAKRQKPKKRGKRISMVVGTNVSYARALEYGAILPGGQPYFKSPEIARAQGNPIPGTDIAFAKKSSPFASRMAKTVPGYLPARPFFADTINDKSNRALVEKEIRKVGKRIREQVRKAVGRPT